MKSGGLEEIGPELLADQLTEGTVVVLLKDGRRDGFTAWVYRIATHVVVFYMGDGIIKKYLALARMPDMSLQDDSHTRVRVFRYLGEV